MLFAELRYTVSMVLCLLITGCGLKTDVTIPAEIQSEALPGGSATVSYKPYPSFVRPAASLPEAARPDFYAGKALANQPWVKAPTVTDARDGLGPIYNARTCLACHVNGGRGLMPMDGNSPLFSAFVRISLPGKDAVIGVVPEPVYGDQIQGQSVALFHQLRGQVAEDDPSRKTEVPPEAYVFVDWQSKSFLYPDGGKVSLRKPELRITELGYGKLHPDTLMSIRNAPAIHGAGLLELISQADIESNADAGDRDGDGISGRLNQVWDFEKKQAVPGRFGWKANRANLRIVTAAAFAGDVGISSPLFGQPCTKAQALCLSTPDGNGEEGVELPSHLLDLVINFTRNIGVPKRRNFNDPQVKAGRQQFFSSGCADCHIPGFMTGKSDTLAHLSEQLIWPYTDLLLHDMGSDLSDGRPDYLATESEWRTPPLWGVGLSQQVNGSKHFLHDGRAQSVEEAILWHGGEAEKSRQYFVSLDHKNRQALIKFVESL